MERLMKFSGVIMFITTCILAVMFGGKSALPMKAKARFMESHSEVYSDRQIATAMRIAKKQFDKQKGKKSMSLAKGSDGHNRKAIKKAKDNFKSKTALTDFYNAGTHSSNLVLLTI